MNRYICIHGHFYQPPRESPWLEAVEYQESAHPYHDWNERVTAECYATNARSRILDDEKFITSIVNNYKKMSFNFGPTLLTWLDKHSPDVYEAILQADQEGRKLHAGHGSALAQVYNHMIMPLANRRDKFTQIKWGIRDFEFRFKRKPEGMWLAETAVDLETLDILAEQGISFTILAPLQAKRVRPPGKVDWEDVSGEKIDPRSPYYLNLPSGRKINLFFYDGPVSRAVAFEKLLSSGVNFAQRLTSLFRESTDQPQLVHMATDGESYGHHHRFGDMALAYALHYIEENNLALITNYGEYLEKYPPSREVEIFENTSWSCAHGIERWRKGCGCNTGANPGWNQDWRGPLREALDWLRDRLIHVFEEKAAGLFRNPWPARDDYIEVILNRYPERVEVFLNDHRKQSLTRDDRIRSLKLLEMQRQAMLMYTSCGWFFDELSGIETLQILQYAARAMQLAQECGGPDLEPGFLGILEKAKSNVARYQDGRRIYEQKVKPSILNLTRVGAHFAVSSLFTELDSLNRVYCYRADLEDHQHLEAGRSRMTVGKVSISSDITEESIQLIFSALHLGDHNINCGVKKYEGDKQYQNMVNGIKDIFLRAEIPETIRAMDRFFGGTSYSLKNLFRDEQRKILEQVLASTMEETESMYQQVFENSAPLMRFLKESDYPPPNELRMAAEIVLNAGLRRAFQERRLDFDHIRQILLESREEGIPLDEENLEYLFRHRIEHMAQQFFEHPVNLPLLQNLSSAVDILNELPFKVNLWQVQNIVYDTLQTYYPQSRTPEGKAKRGQKEWVNLFLNLCRKMTVRVEP